MSQIDVDDPLTPFQARTRIKTSDPPQGGHDQREQSSTGHYRKVERTGRRVLKGTFIAAQSHAPSNSHAFPVSTLPKSRQK